MKLNLRSLPILGLAFIVSFTACKKETTTDTEAATETEIKGHSEDQSRVSNDLDEITNDANLALESNPSFSGRVSQTNNICNATAVPDTTGGTWKITITYNGNNCSGTHHRTGTVILSTPAGTRWKNAGAAITVTFQNLKIKRLADNKSITINGVQTLTNVSGGLLANLASLQNIVHTITSNNMSITFDDNTQRTWQVGRKRTFTFNNGAVMTVTGIGVAGNVTNAAEWGTNRFGHTFITTISHPLVVRQDCNFRLTAGEIMHQGFATSSVKFGLDANGNPTTCPQGVFYYKLTWTGPAGNSHSVILPY